MRSVQNKLWMEQRQYLILNCLYFKYNLKYQLLIALHSFSLTCKTFPTEKLLFFFNFKYFILNLIEFSFWELHKKHFIDCKNMCCVFHIFPFLFSVRFFLLYIIKYSRVFCKTVFHSYAQTHFIWYFSVLDFWHFGRYFI